MNETRKKSRVEWLREWADFRKLCVGGVVAEAVSKNNDKKFKDKANRYMKEQSPAPPYEWNGKEYKQKK